MNERARWRWVIWESVRMALETLRGQSMRSFLLILGVAIGTATLLAMISLLFGLKGKLREDIVAANRPYINITKYDPFDADDVREGMGRKNFSYEDAKELEERAQTMDTVVFTREIAPNVPPPMIFYQDKRAEFIWVWGSSEGTPEIFNLPMGDGRFIGEDDILRRRRVVVLGFGPVRELFPHSDPLGKEVRVGTERYRVIGTFNERKHLSGRLGENYACIPYTTFEKDFGTEDDQVSIQAGVREGYTTEQATQEAYALMRVIRGLRPGEKNDFSILASETLQGLLDSLTLGVMLALVVLSSIGLLVGGIGVMNMLLISVTERTREVGVRRAMGARRGDVLLQFLLEATVLTGLGGVVGAGLGYALARGLTGYLGFPFYWGYWMLALALGFSMMVGLVFGAYPARRAARMQPIDALRNE